MRELSHSLSPFAISGHRIDHRPSWLRRRRPPYTVVGNKKDLWRCRRWDGGVLQAWLVEGYDAHGTRVFCSANGMFRLWAIGLVWVVSLVGFRSI
ncbi:hypothetical protein V6Z11_A09G027200 [Gossypium hirsutum]